MCVYVCVCEMDAAVGVSCRGSASLQAVTIETTLPTVRG